MIGFIIENQVVAHGVDVMNFLDFLFFIQSTVIITMDFFLFVRWLQRVFGRVMLSWWSWSFSVEWFFHCCLLGVFALRAWRLFWIEVLCFPWARLSLWFSCLQLMGIVRLCGVSYLWVFFLCTIVFYVPVFNGISIRFQASTNFCFAHIPELHLRIFFVLILPIVRQVVILIFLTTIQLTKHIQFIDGRRRIIPDVICTGVNSSHFWRLHVLWSLRWRILWLIFTQLMLILALRWSGSFE